MASRAPRRFHEPTAVRLAVGADQVALCGELGEVRLHRHASAAIVVGLDAPVGVIAERRLDAAAALIAPGLAHALEVRGRVAVFLLPPTAIARAGLAAVTTVAPRHWLELAHAVADGTFDDFSSVTRLVTARPVDDRVAIATSILAATLASNLPAARLADAVSLSPSRLMALVHAELGTSLRGYRRWLRTFAVARRYAAGASLTEAAHEAGFASSAHLVTAARASFGIRPSQVLAPANRALIRAL